MFKYDIALLPSAEERDLTMPEWAISDVIHAVMNDDDAANLASCEVEDYHSLVVAYGAEGIYGFLHVEYDHNEMEIVIGRQVLNAALSPEESDFMGAELARQAQDLYEDLF